MSQQKEKCRCACTAGSLCTVAGVILFVEEFKETGAPYDKMVQLENSLVISGKKCAMAFFFDFCMLCKAPSIYL